MNFREPVKALSKEEMESMNLKYYNPEIHKAAFVLPEFARKVKRDDLFFYAARLYLIQMRTCRCFVSLSVFLVFTRYLMKRELQQLACFFSAWLWPPRSMTSQHRTASLKRNQLVGTCWVICLFPSFSLDAFLLFTFFLFCVCPSIFCGYQYDKLVWVGRPMPSKPDLTPKRFTVLIVQLYYLHVMQYVTHHTEYIIYCTCGDRCIFVWCLCSYENMQCLFIITGRSGYVLFSNTRIL